MTNMADRAPKDQDALREHYLRELATVKKERACWLAVGDEQAVETYDEEIQYYEALLLSLAQEDVT